MPWEKITGKIINPAVMAIRVSKNAIQPGSYP